MRIWCASCAASMSQEIRAVADYLSRLQGSGAVKKTMRSDGVVVY